MNNREPLINPVELAELRPTQITVGLKEVQEKRRQWRAHVHSDGPEFLGRHMMPVVLGPKGRHYIVDHHHLARALDQEGVKEVLITVVADLRHLQEDDFWFVLDNRNWMHPFDAEGKRRGYEDIPISVRDLTDDPFRSLAGELRRLGGFAKDTAPFSEFLWTNFLRRRLTRQQVEADFNGCLDQALTLAKSAAAEYLPGWCGPHAG